jgi:hypothetical protein
VRALDRRALLLGAGAAAFAAGMAGCDTAKPLAQPGPPKTESSSSSPAHSTSFRSAARKGITVSYQVLLPPGHSDVAGLAVCLVLHGKGDDHRAAVNLVHLDKALATVTRAGLPPIALVAVDGGLDTYWHLRADGDDGRR